MRNAAKDRFIVGTENYLVYLQAQEHGTAASKGDNEMLGVSSQRI